MKYLNADQRNHDDNDNNNVTYSETSVIYNLERQTLTFLRPLILNKTEFHCN